MNWKSLLVVLMAISFGACSSKKEIVSPSEAKKHLDEKYTALVGKATKQDLISDFGNPEWCRMEDNGLEVCRFYRKKGTKWIGEEGRDKKSVSRYDQIIADFDSKGILKAFTSSALR